MEYSVVAFYPVLKSKDSRSEAAKQLQDLINNQAKSGWLYERLETVSTVVEGTKGCFGIGATPNTALALQMVVFRRES